MSLEATLDATVGENEVTFEFSVANTGDSPVDVRFNSGQTADVFVYEAGTEPADPEDGDPVWQWSGDRFFTQALRDETIAPGESITEELVWDDPESGSFVAIGTLAANTDAQARTTLSV